MILAHEGLPRSGKSYEAMVKHVLEAIKKSRKVFARVDGLNHQKIAEVLDLPLEHVQKHLIHLTPEQVPEVYKYVEDKSFIVLDEAHKYWPTSRQKLSPVIAEFISEHGHQEIDILIMSQHLKDVHSMWRHRVDKKIQFTKRDAVGRPNDYTWRTYKQNQPDKWLEVMSGKGTYDPKYFGIYKSHTTDDPEGENYYDKRAVVWNHPYIKYGGPAAVLLLVVGISYTAHFFNPNRLKTEPKEKAPEASKIVPKPIPHELQPSKPMKGKALAQEEQDDDPIIKALEKGRPRLAGLIRSNKGYDGLVQFLEGGNLRVYEQLSVRQLHALGWSSWIDSDATMIRFVKGSHQFIATSWPADPFGRVSTPQNDAIREAGQAQ